MRIGMACLMLVVLTALLGVVAQEPVRFSDPERVAGFLDARPYRAVALLEQALSQEQVTALEQAMFPAPTVDEQRRGYEQVRTRLLRLNLAPDDPAIVEIDRKLAALRAEPQEL